MVHGSNDEEFPDNDLVASDYNGNAINAKLGSLVGGTFQNSKHVIVREAR